MALSVWRYPWTQTMALYVCVTFSVDTDNSVVCVCVALSVGTDNGVVCVCVTLFVDTDNGVVCVCVALSVSVWRCLCLCGVVVSTRGTCRTLHFLPVMSIGRSSCVILLTLLGSSDHIWFLLIVLLLSASCYEFSIKALSYVVFVGSKHDMTCSASPS